jgi:hypothetical protein
MDARRTPWELLWLVGALAWAVGFASAVLIWEPKQTRDLDRAFEAGRAEGYDAGRREAIEEVKEGSVIIGPHSAADHQRTQQEITR